jgi:hypothetical protein
MMVEENGLFHTSACHKLEHACLTGWWLSVRVCIMETTAGCEQGMQIWVNRRYKTVLRSVYTLSNPCRRCATSKSLMTKRQTVSGSGGAAGQSEMVVVQVGGFQGKVDRWLVLTRTLLYAEWLKLTGKPSLSSA